MSRQMTFTLTCAALLAAVVPGCAGYLSARLDAVDEARRRLASAEDRLRESRLTAQAVATPARLCSASDRSPARRREASVPTAFVPADARERRNRATERANRRERAKSGSTRADPPPVLSRGPAAGRPWTSHSGGQERNAREVWRPDETREAGPWPPGLLPAEDPWLPPVPPVGKVRPFGDQPGLPRHIRGPGHG
ncbi:hypothetical protein [Planomonospora sp. ID82291]|uniref:hypothetical protein n=1 Tax=Planomonospora sp. ID82291 TaxID=2738136 RepID=UPI0018C3F8B3|nr:hypothetical protein [Planomonospora sp. ID82291]MBG0813996.1 hypothetical protein [Planomonospora sp. ID82291]